MHRRASNASITSSVSSVGGGGYEQRYLQQQHRKKRKEWGRPMSPASMRSATGSVMSNFESDGEVIEGDAAGPDDQQVFFVPMESSHAGPGVPNLNLGRNVGAPPSQLPRPGRRGSTASQSSSDYNMPMNTPGAGRDRMAPIPSSARSFITAPAESFRQRLNINSGQSRRNAPVRATGKGQRSSVRPPMGMRVPDSARSTASAIVPGATAAGRRGRRKQQQQQQIAQRNNETSDGNNYDNSHVMSTGLYEASNTMTLEMISRLQQIKSEIPTSVSKDFCVMLTLQFLLESEMHDAALLVEDRMGGNWNVKEEIDLSNALQKRRFDVAIGMINKAAKKDQEQQAGEKRKAPAGLLRRAFEDLLYVLYKYKVIHCVENDNLEEAYNVVEIDISKYIKEEKDDQRRMWFQRDISSLKAIIDQPTLLNGDSHGNTHTHTHNHYVNWSWEAELKRFWGAARRVRAHVLMPKAKDSNANLSPFPLFAHAIEAYFLARSARITLEDAVKAYRVHFRLSKEIDTSIERFNSLQTAINATKDAHKVMSTVSVTSGTGHDGHLEHSRSHPHSQSDEQRRKSIGLTRVKKPAGQETPADHPHLPPQRLNSRTRNRHLQPMNPTQMQTQIEGGDTSSSSITVNTNVKTTTTGTGPRTRQRPNIPDLIIPSTSKSQSDQDMSMNTMTSTSRSRDRHQLQPHTPSVSPRFPIQKDPYSDGTPPTKKPPVPRLSARSSNSKGVWQRSIADDDGVGVDANEPSVHMFKSGSESNTQSHSQSDAQLSLPIPHEGENAEYRLRHRIMGHSSSPRVAAIARDKCSGVYVMASAGDDRTIMVSSVLDGIKQRQINAHSKPITALGFNPLFPQVLASASHDKLVRAWNWESGEMLCSWGGLHTHSIHDVSFVPGDSDRLVSCSSDHSMKLWNLHDKKTFEATINSNSPFTAFTFHSEGRVVMGCQSNGQIRVYKLKTGSLLSTIRFRTLREAWLTSISVHPTDPNYILVGGDRISEIPMFDIRAASRGPVQAFAARGFKSGRNSYAGFSPGGQYVYANSNSAEIPQGFGADSATANPGAIFVWNMTTGKVSAVVRDMDSENRTHHALGAKWMAFGGNLKHRALVAPCSDGIVRVWG